MTSETNHHYRDLIFTKHALDRLHDRSLAKEAIYQTIHAPDRTHKLGGHKKKFVKSHRQRLYQVVAEFNPQQQAWVIISAWVRGESDREPLVWQLLILPFKIAWWLVQTGWRLLTRSTTKKR